MGTKAIIPRRAERRRGYFTPAMENAMKARTNSMIAIKR